jgi:hypothetical protein
MVSFDSSSSKSAYESAKLVGEVADAMVELSSSSEIVLALLAFAALASTTP